jgi:multidrug efflux pump subunit AcrA (membrane-fusion protein)
MSKFFSFRNFRTASLPVLLAAALLTVSCGRDEKASQQPGGSVGSAAAAGKRPVEITTGQAVTREVSAFLQATGSFAADEASDVAPETSGRVVATPVDVGAFVSQGAVIARLNDRDARIRLQQAQASEQQAAATVRQAEAGLGLGGGRNFDAASVPEALAARDQLESAEAAARLADTNARRLANLLETGDTSRSVYDQARTQAETSRAQANAAKRQYQTALNTARQDNQGIEGAQAALAGARSQVALAQKAVADTVITAPISGYVSDRPIAVGEYVTPASKLATILRTSPIKLRLQVPEMEAARVRQGMSVSVSVDAYRERQFAGQVTAVNPAIDPTSRAITVEANVANDGNLLRPGMFATARVTQPGGEQAVYVPRSAVQFDTNTNASRLFVVEPNGTVRLVVVQVGEQENDSVRITSGLAGGEMVATSNVEQLYEGAPVISR